MNNTAAVAAPQHRGIAPNLKESGHSMGGRGTWLLAYKQPEKFAAILPMSDAPLDDAWAKQIAKVPAWVFHGTDDDLEPFEEPRVLSTR